MELQIQPNRYSCLPTAFAMCVDVPINVILEELGHNGVETPYHPQELIDICWDLGYVVMTIEIVPTIRPPIEHPCMTCGKPRDDDIVLFGEERIQARFMEYLNGNIGVLTGETITHQRHAVAWTGQFILDPNGSRYTLDLFNSETFFLIHKK